MAFVFEVDGGSIEHVRHPSWSQRLHSPNRHAVPGNVKPRWPKGSFAMTKFDSVVVEKSPPEKQTKEKVKTTAPRKLQIEREYQKNLLMLTNKIRYLEDELPHSDVRSYQKEASLKELNWLRGKRDTLCAVFVAQSAEWEHTQSLASTFPASELKESVRESWCPGKTKVANIPEPVFTMDKPRPKSCNQPVSPSVLGAREIARHRPKTSLAVSQYEELKCTKCILEVCRKEKEKLRTRHALQKQEKLALKAEVASVRKKYQLLKGEFTTSREQEMAIRLQLEKVKMENVLLREKIAKISPENV